MSFAFSIALVTWFPFAFHASYVRGKVINVWHLTLSVAATEYFARHSACAASLLADYGTACQIF